jgi:hypothetical protein
MNAAVLHLAAISLSAEERDSVNARAAIRASRLGSSRLHGEGRMPSHPIRHDGIAKLTRSLSMWAIGSLLIKDHRAHFGRIDMRAQAEGPSALRADTPRAMGPKRATFRRTTWASSEFNEGSKPKPFPRSLSSNKSDPVDLFGLEPAMSRKQRTGPAATRCLGKTCSIRVCSPEES